MARRVSRRVSRGRGLAGIPSVDPIHAWIHQSAWKLLHALTRRLVARLFSLSFFARFFKGPGGCSRVRSTN
jgi:hypothetical protein